MKIRCTVAKRTEESATQTVIRFNAALVECADGESVSRTDMFLTLTPENAAVFQFGKTYDFIVPEVANEDVVVEPEPETPEEPIEE